MTFQTIPHDSERYWQTVDLRREALRTPLKMDFSSEELAAEFQSQHFALIDPIRDTVLACCIIHESAPSTMRLRQMAVHHDHRGQGLGRKLISNVEQILHQTDARTLELHARKTVEAFYQKLGFEAVGGDFIEIGISHQKMTKRIG